MKRKSKIIFATIILLIIAFRLLLPGIVLKYVNNKLNTMEEYRGHVEDIHIRLYRGQYSLVNLTLFKIDKKTKSNEKIPFFKSSVTDLSIEWKSLLSGKIAGEINLDRPEMNIVGADHKNEKIKENAGDFRTVIKDLMPLKINHISVIDGKISYIDPYAEPRIDLSIKDLSLEASNISNVTDSSKLLPSHLRARGNTQGGTFELVVDFDGLNKVPTFDMNFRFKDIDLVALNDLFKAHGNFEVKEGRFGLYGEVAAKKGQFGGYVKPIIKDVEFTTWKETKGSFGHKVWQKVVSITASVLKDSEKEQVATKIEFGGSFKDPDLNILRAVSFVLRNAFVRALAPSLDNSINIHKLQENDKKTFLEKLLGD